MLPCGQHDNLSSASGGENQWHVEPFDKLRVNSAKQFYALSRQVNGMFGGVSHPMVAIKGIVISICRRGAGAAEGVSRPINASLLPNTPI
jgi:hypothetical protein